MLGVRQWRHVAFRHGAFYVSKQPRLCRRWTGRIFMYYSWKAVVVIHRLWNNVYHRESRTISQAEITQNCMHSKCLQILAEEDFTLKLLRRTPIKIPRRADQRRQPRSREHRLAQRRQRRQHSDHKRVQRQSAKAWFSWLGQEQGTFQSKLLVYTSPYWRGCVKNSPLSPHVFCPPGLGHLPTVRAVPRLSVWADQDAKSPTCLETALSWSAKRKPSGHILTNSDRFMNWGRHGSRTTVKTKSCYCREAR